MKKRLGTLLLIMTMLFSLAACGSVDKQPAIDAFNSASTAFDAVANKVNAQSDAYSQELIAAMNEKADTMLAYKDQLEGEEKLTKDQVTEMVQIFAEVKEWATATDAKLEEYKITDTSKQPENGNKADDTAKQPETEDGSKADDTAKQPETESGNEAGDTTKQPETEDNNKTAVVDKQTALDAYNRAGEVFNRAVIKITENMGAYPLTVIETMGQMANSLTVYSEILSGEEAFTEEQIQEMVKQFADIETWAANVESGNLGGLTDGNGRDLSTAIAYFNTLSADFNGIATYVNEYADAFSQDYINSMNEIGEILTGYQSLLEGNYSFTDEEYDQMMNDFAVIAQWLSDAEEEVFG